MADHSILPPIGLGGSGAPSYDGGRASRCSSRSSNASTPRSRVPSAYQGSVSYELDAFSNERLRDPEEDYCVFRNQRSRSDSTRSRHAGNRFTSLRSRSTSDVRSEGVKSRYTTYHTSPRMDKNGFLQRSPSEECLKCMLKIPHNKCEGHKYIRVGGGYRHSYLYVKAMLEELELKKKAEALLQQRLEAIQEKQVKAIKTYIRTKSGKLVERMIFLSEEDYQQFIAGGKEAEDIIRKYLSKEDAKGLEKWEKDEQRAITTFIRTKSGRRIEKIVYVSKEEYDAIKRGDIDATEALKKYIKPEEGTVEGWGEAEMKEIKTYIRTKSGRVIEKRILVSKEDFEKLQELEKQGKDPGEIFKKYMSMNEGEKVESWKKPEPTAMKVVKAYVRTKSGKLIEKTIMMTEEEYQQFQASGGDVSQLHKYMNLQKGEVVEDWEKASTVYSASDDEEVKKAIPGTKIVGKDGTVYEVVVDPITGKKYKKKLGGKESDVDSGIGSLRNKKGAHKGPYGIGIDEEDPAEAKMTKEEVKAYRAGKRRDDSDSDYSYRSVKSAGGTRHVYRKHKRADGTYSDEESYHSDQDEEGKKRRQMRRGERKKQAIGERKKKFEQGKRNTGSDSEYSYKSEVSVGGTRHVKRRRKRADGTYSGEESYHSSQDEEGEKRRRKRRKERIKAVKEGKRRPGSASDYSYKSEVSAGGTRHVKRRRKRADGTYSREESYHSSQDEGGQDRRKQRRKKRQEAFKQGKRNKDSDSDYSYRSVVSAGGTRHVKRRHRRADGTYSREESYHSDQDKDGETRRRRRRRERKHGAGSAHSYHSVISAGGTRHVKRRRRRADGTYSASESYHSSDSDFFVGKGKKGKKKRREHGSDSNHSYYSVVSAGGTKQRKRKERIRDKDGKVIGYAKSEAYTSPSDSDASYEMKPDGKGGMMRVKKKGNKGKPGKRPEWKPGAQGYVSDPLDNDSLQSTDSEAEKEILKNMTKEEKEKYFQEKAKRKEEREKKRKEKYGEKYEEIMEKHEKAKKAKKEWKSMVNYERGGRGGPGDGYDDREPGMGHDEWTKGKKKGKKYKDGNEADDETEDALGSGIGEGKEKIKRLADGSRILSDGTKLLPDGTKQLPDGTMVLADGTKQLPDGTKVLADGTKQLPDGTKVLADGTKQLPDGTKLLPDGTKQLPDGTKLLPDGTKQLPDGIKVLPDGTKELPDGSKILSDGSRLPPGVNYYQMMPDGSKVLEDGTKVLYDGTKVLPDGTKILPDGTRLSPKGTKHFPDGSKLLPNGSRKLEDGTEILPDGTKILPNGDVIMSDGKTGKVKKLPDGSRILPDGSKVLADGTKVLTDGTRVKPDGTIEEDFKVKPGPKPGKTKRLADGSKILPDGSKVLPDGSKVLPDGTRRLADGTEILPDGTKILPNGTVEMADGKRGKVKKLKDGSRMLPDGSRILPDGSRRSPGGSKILQDGSKLLSDGSKILPDGTRISRDKVLPDGSHLMEDGSRVLPDGSKVLLDGTKELVDGSKILPDGSKVLADGTTIPADQVLPDGSHVLQNGSHVLTDGSRVLANGTKILPDGTKLLPDGSKILPDGRKVLPDGTKIKKNKVLPDGSHILPDGSRMLVDGSIKQLDGTTVLPDGTKVLPDGTKELPDGSKVMPDGSTKLPDGTTVLADGTKVMQDGSKVMPDGTKVLTDGSQVLPDGTIVSRKGKVVVRGKRGREGRVNRRADGTKVLPDGTVVAPDGKIRGSDGREATTLLSAGGDKHGNLGIDGKTLGSPNVMSKLNPGTSLLPGEQGRGGAGRSSNLLTKPIQGDATKDIRKQALPDTRPKLEKDLTGVSTATQHESDGEGGKRKKKKKGTADSDEESVYEYARDAQGNILRDEKGNPIKKKVGTISKKGKKKGGAGGDDSDSDFEYKYDAEGNLIRKRKEKRDDGEESDGDYFEVAADGSVTLKKGKKKIDISKLTSDQLKQLGIDPNLSKQEITRLLKEKFGDDIRIESHGKKVGLKHLDDYGSDANTDDLADDSDLDTSTLTGQRRVRVLMRRGGADMLDHLKKLITSSNIVDPEIQHPEERDASIDFLNHYRLVDTNKLDPYARAFAVEDEDLDCVITTKDARTALDGVPTIQSINKKQVEYVLKVLDIDKETAVTFRMFAVMVAVAERVTHMDSHCKRLLEIANLRDIERKMALYKSMFYCNVEGDRNPNYIKADSLKIDLIAGGLSWKQQEYIMEKMQPNEWREVSFLDYLTYIPLFMSMHDNICDNPLDMSNNKYGARASSPAQRDMNPLGYPLKKNSVFIQRHQRAKDLSKKAEDLLSGKKPHAEALKESGELLNKYQKLPGIIGKNDTRSYMSKGKMK